MSHISDTFTKYSEFRLRLLTKESFPFVPSPSPQDAMQPPVREHALLVNYHLKTKKEPSRWGANNMHPMRWEGGKNGKRYEKIDHNIVYNVSVLLQTRVVM